MRVGAWAGAHRRSLLFLLAVLVLSGMASALRLPVGLFPQVDFPRIVVSLEARDRPGEQMVVAVTRPVEQAVRPVPGVREIRSVTTRGSAELSVNFAWGTDMAAALLQVDSAVNQSLPTLPSGSTFSARRMDPTVFPVAAYSLTSTQDDLVQLRDIAEYQLAPLLSAIEGVARVDAIGGAQAEYRVDVDPAQLQAYGLTMDDVAKALSAANVLQAVGRLEDRYKLYLLLSDTRFRSLDEIRRTILRSGANGLVQLSDIADITVSTEPQWLRVTANGRDAVSIQIYQQPDGNTVDIVRAVGASLDGYRHKLPAGVVIANWYDQSQLITASAASVRDAIAVGAALAAGVLLVFLRRLRITLIAILVVPAVLSATALLLYALGMSFNMMTLGGMAAAVGLIIDDAIVMIEHIVRRLREDGGEPRDRIRMAAREFTPPLCGSSAATVIIFLPLAFLGGVTGAFFKALSLTMASALVISFLVAWLIVPLLAEHLLRAERNGPPAEGHWSAWTHARYRRLMSRLFTRPGWLLVGLVPLLALGAIGYRQVGSGFMPVMDEGGFVLDYRAPPGTSLTETDRLLRQVEELIRALPEVTSYSRRTGAALGGGLTEANEGDFFIQLKPPPRRPAAEVMDELRGLIQTRVPGLDIELIQLIEDLIGDLTAVPQPIEIKLYGDDVAQLLATAPKVAAAIGRIAGVVEVQDGIIVAGDALDIQVDRTKAALEGIDPDAVTQQLNAHLSGTVTTQVQQGDKLIGIRLWVPQELRRTQEQIAGLLIQAPDGHRFPLRRIAHIQAVTGQPQISRDNLKQMVAVTGRISGRDLGSTIRDVKQALAGAALVPAPLYYELGGLYQQQQIAFRGLLAVLVAAAALVFTLLLFLYERFRVAIAILLMPLLAMAAVFIGLWVTGTELNITAMMGMTMVLGIVTEVAVFYFSEYTALIAAGAEPRAALADAGVNRMRPIAMTTIATALALMPLAIGWGQGAAMQQPLAIAIISGLIVQLPLVLILMPVLFARLPGRP